MKGLMSVAFLIVKENIIPSIVVLFIVSLIGILEHSHLQATSLLLVTFPTTYLMRSRSDVAQKFSKLEKIMPLTIKVIILSKYLIFLIFLWVSFGLMAIYLSVNFIINGTILSLIEINLLLFTLGGLISFVSFFYPLSLQFKDSQHESLIGVAFLLPVMHIGLFVFVMNNTIFEVLNDTSAGFVYVISSIIIFVISYLISKIIYSKKSYD